MTQPLVPTSFLFRYALPCVYHPLEWAPGCLALPEACRLAGVGELDGRRPFADVRVAWNERGLGFSCRVEGKRRSLWCRETQFDESDGLHVWVDTRNTQNIHRASRFCHRFSFLPTGGGARREEAVAGQLFINRAREHARAAPPDRLLVRSQVRPSGYLLEALILAGALTGYDPGENPRLGFTYAVIDREFGVQALAVSGEFPYEEDPSLWSTLELVGAG